MINQKIFTLTINIILIVILILLFKNWKKEK
jgi:hypothetical protein